MTFRDWAEEISRKLANQDDECEIRSAWVKFYVKNAYAGSVLVYQSAFDKFGAAQLSNLLEEHWAKPDLKWIQITESGVSDTYQEAPNRPGKGLRTKH